MIGPCGPAVGCGRDRLRSKPFARGPQGPLVSITLYELEDCPYCITVANALQEADVPYETEWVDGLHSKRDEVNRLSGQRAVPVLVDEERGVTMPESENILEYVERTLA